MLDPIHPYGREIRPFVSPHIQAEVASESWQLAAYYELREQIFVAEQGLFADTDRDACDLSAVPIVAACHLAGMADEVIGIVRIYQAEPGVWFGGRLGVSRRYRRNGTVGTALITCAVSTAHAYGCLQFLATVQQQNVRYFERHHFRSLKAVEVCGQPHQLMQADLACYPPCPRALARLEGRAA